VDVLLIAPTICAPRWASPASSGHQRVADAYKTMIDACRNARKFPGMAGIYNEPIMQRYIDMGARFILSATIANFLMASATQRTGFLRQALHKT